VVERCKRQVNGLLLLDKPTGMTSNAALQSVKRLYQARKAGHCGSLDPLASGLLPICLGEATKISGYLLDANKTYRFTCRLGVTTTTGDAEGQVLDSRPVAEPDKAQVAEVLRGFTGPIDQVPPMHSALKHQGQRLYRLARQGIEVERRPRRVFIHELQLLDLRQDCLTCTVTCSKGTYVRTLAEDIGWVLGCGAHLIELRRTGVEPFDASQMVTLDSLRTRAGRGLTAMDSLLLPMDRALCGWPEVRLSADMAYYLRLGQAVSTLGAPRRGWVRLYRQDQFLGVGEILANGRVAPRRLVRYEE
jgi:tRNA pseudouridine55 synthase